MERFGRYDLVRRIGVGGMAEIFLARSQSLDGFEKELVIKRVRPELSADERFSSMFIDEGRISITLSHPNVVQVFDFGEHQGAYYLAMEYVDGVNLAELAAAQGVRDVGLEAPLALLVIGEVLKALDYAHHRRGRGGEELPVIHRDVTPHNVLVSFDGAVKLGDFGIAKTRDSVSRPSPGMVLGKVAYMAPEHLQGDPLDLRADLFSTGLVLWELLVGRSPYAAQVRAGVYERVLEARVDPPSLANPRLPRAIDPLVMRALARDREQRYASARDFGHEIHAYLVRHHPEANLYDLQSFVAARRDELERATGRVAGRTAGASPSAPATGGRTLPLAAGAGAPPAGPAAAPAARAWSAAVQGLAEAFANRPSLWLLLELAETCRAEGDRASAAACYHAAAARFARRGLLAPALLACRGFADVVRDTDPAAARSFPAAVPALVGCGAEALPRSPPGTPSAMAGLLDELLCAAAGNATDVGQPTPILAHLDGEGFAELVAKAPLATFAEGAAVVKQGEVGRTMFLIARGRVLVHATGPDGRRVYLSSLTAGDFFGENGFFTGAPRSATVEALYRTDVFEIDRPLYNQVTAPHPAASGILLQFYKDRIVETVLVKSPVFGLLDPTRRRATIERFTPRVFRDGELVIREGTENDQIYLVKDGEAEVFTEARGERTQLSWLGPGTLFGEVAALRRIARTASVRARGRLEVLELARSDFESLLGSEPELRRRVLEVVGQRARDNLDKLMSAAGPKPGA